MKTKKNQYKFQSEEPEVRSAMDEQSHLKSIYSGVSTNEVNTTKNQETRESGSKFFGKGGPSMFMALNRNSGHINPAFEDDGDGDTDPYCNSNHSTDTEEGSDRRESVISSQDSILTQDMPPLYDDTANLPNGKIANGGRDFKVDFNVVQEQSRPPPPERAPNDKKTPKTWDRFTSTSEDNVSSEDITFWKKIFVLTKIVFAFFLFFLTLGTAVVNKICFIIITANIFPPTNKYNKGLKTADGKLDYNTKVQTKTNVMWIWALVMLIGAPFLFSFLRSFWMVVFQVSRRGSPEWSTIFLMLLLETIHCIGLNIMVFVIVPNMDPVSGLLLTTAVGVVPGLLKVIYPTVKKDARQSTTMHYIANAASVIGAIGQIATIGLWCYHVYLSFGNSFESIPYLVCLIVSPIFTSVYWWENYVHEGKKDSTGLPKLARSIRKCRTKLVAIASVWKMALTIILPTAIYGIYCTNGSDCVHTLYYEKESATLHSGIGETDLISGKNFGKCNDYLPLVVGAIGVLCSGSCFKLGKIACKIMTQIVDFSLPLALSTPVAVGVILCMYAGFITTESVGCSLPFPVWDETKGTSTYFANFMDDYTHWVPMIAGVVGFFSLMLVTNHVWMPGKERLQRTDRLFVHPLYCGIISDQSLLLNRRRIEKVKISDTHKSKLRKIMFPEDSEQDLSTNTLRTDDTPIIYMCATMWHENENEMTQLLKSIFRMDEDQCIRKHTQFLLSRRDPDYYEFEAHIFFDDAFEGHRDDEYDFKVNSYVKLLIKTVQFSASAVTGINYKIPPPVKVATPYGGRLVWTLPGGNKLIAHLKDKAVIRHRKRWSQVMYMYYFLAFQLFNIPMKRNKLQKRADNTFLLALDGDVDFHPHAVLLLVDRMRKNSDVGAACGRIHPIGDGAMVWYQKFEYAVSHWLQKAAEDKLGCVLCSPGCFSLFRGSALMDDNVMNKYTTPPTEPRHYVQYDQGEDRWLCTLLLQQGHRVEYCAASDALTYAPEGFYEFFNQRRRWTPSTMANILDLLTDWKNVTAKNPEISLVYIFYQGLLMVSSILTPGAIFLMILGAINMAYPAIDLWVALLVNLLPIVGMVLLCFCAKPQPQLTYAAILSTFYSLVMMIVIVGLLRQAADYGLCSVTIIFLCFIAGVFVISAFIHPQEFWCIIHGCLYFLAIPAMSMVLMIYSLGNLHVVSWGTRENKTVAEVREEKKKEKLSGVIGFFERCFSGESGTRAEDARLHAILDRLDGIEDTVRGISEVGSSRFTNRSGSSLVPRTGSPLMMNDDAHVEHFSDFGATVLDGGAKRDNPLYEEEKQKKRDILINPFWMEEKDMVGLKRDEINQEEITFWEELMEQYLKPIEHNKDEQDRVSADLIELRNKVCLIFILINSLFVIVVFSLQQVAIPGSSISIALPCAAVGTDGKIDGGQSIEPISVAFTLVFGLLLLLQFICMLMHRLATLLHICAATEIFKKKRKVSFPDSPEDGDEEDRDAFSYEQVYEMVRDMQKDQDADSVSMTSESSYAPSEVDEEEDAAERKKQAKLKWRRLAKNRKKAHGTMYGDNFRKNFERFQSMLKDDGEQEEDDGETPSAEEDEERMAENIKRKMHFNRFRNKSLHTLAYMAKSKEMRKSITKKKLVAKKKWHAVIERIKLNNINDTKDATDGAGTGKRKTSADVFKQAALAMRAKEAEVKVIDEEDDESEIGTPTVHRYEMQPKAGTSGNEEHYEDIDRYTKITTSADIELRETESQPHLQVPHVENDEWPDEDNYAVVDKYGTTTEDTLF